jgi:hypothetical protein
MEESAIEIGIKYCHVVWSDDEILNWRLDILTTLAHHFELLVITAPSLISTPYKSFQPAVSSLVVVG